MLKNFTHTHAMYAYIYNTCISLKNQCLGTPICYDVYRCGGQHPLSAYFNTIVSEAISINSHGCFSLNADIEAVTGMKLGKFANFSVNAAIKLHSFRNREFMRCN